MNRLFKIIFVILLVIISGELAYYYVYIQFINIKKDIHENTNATPTQIIIPTITDLSTSQPIRSTYKEVLTYLLNCKSIPTCKGGWTAINIEGKVREKNEDNNIVGGIKLRLYKNDSSLTHDDDIVYINLKNANITDKDGNLTTVDHIKTGNLIGIEIKYDYSVDKFFYNIKILK